MLTMEEYDALSEAEKADAIMQGHFLADWEETAWWYSFIVSGYYMARYTMIRSPIRSCATGYSRARSN